MIGAAIVAASFLLSLITALVVLLKNPRSGTHVYFASLVFFIAAYPIFNYLAINASSSSVALFWAKFVLFVSIPQGPLLYFFAHTYPSHKYVFNRRLQATILVWALINIFLAAFGLIFSGVDINNGAVTIKPGPFIALFGLLHASTILAGIFNLRRKYLSSRGLRHLQTSYIFFGMAISFSLTFLITFVLPLLFGNGLLLAISPLFLSLSVLSVAYAIVRHKLFDIRMIIARFITYTVLVAALVVMYSGAVFAILLPLSKVTGNVLTLHTVYVMAAIFLAFTLQPLKNLIDHLTNKYFYQDAYSAQMFLNEFNQLLVGNSNLNQLLKSVIRVIESNLKTSHGYFIVRGVSYNPYVANKTSFDEDSLFLIHDSLVCMRRKVVITEDLDDKHQKLHSLLQKANIMVIVRVTGKTAGSTEDLGYLFLGPKKSGSPYNRQDLAMMELISNELTLAIQNALHFEEIQNFNVELQSKVEEATRRLRHSNEKLKMLDETKDDFISMASHQLRTPLTSVKGYLSMVLDGDAGKISPLQRQMLEQAFVSSQRMTFLIADLLNLSRLKTGKFIIDASPTNLAAIVQEEISQLEDTARSRDLQLVFNAPESFPVMMLDETKVRQVIMNFIDNAIYYTPKGGTINVVLEDRPTSVSFTVKDTGIGVPTDVQPKLFTKFYRADNAKRARPDGTGLGLFMAKKVIVAQGGAILFKSEENKGSTFGFTFSKTPEKLVTPEAPA